MIINLDASDVWGYVRFTHYLICEPHPLREMIKQQTDTGQRVWIKTTKCTYSLDGMSAEETVLIIDTTTPDWNIPNAEYRFTPFED